MPQYLETAAAAADAGVPQNWLDQLAPASFRGVEFHVDTIEWTAGDNVVVREYPFQDLPTVFSMGAGSEEIKLSAYVIGDDYHLQRDALRGVLNGEGLLMHPTAGMLRVAVAGKYSIKEAPTTEGGMARFDLHFVLAETRRYPSGAPSTQAAAAAQADVFKDAAAEAFAENWTVARAPGWMAEQAVQRLQDTLAGATGRISAAAGLLNDYNAEINASYRAFADGLQSLVQAPRQLADAVVQLYRLPQDLSRATARDLRTAFAWAFNLGQQLPRRPFEQLVIPPPGVKNGPPPGIVIYGTGHLTALVAGSASQRRLNGLASASDRLIESLSLAAWVQAAAAAELQDYAEAMALRATLQAQCTRLLLATSADGSGSSAWHDALGTLQTTALADLQKRSRDLVRLTSYTPEGWQPLLYVSWRVYGTAKYADEIAALNPHVEHPLLAPPGRALRLLRHD